MHPTIKIHLRIDPDKIPGFVDFLSLWCLLNKNPESFKIAQTLPSFVRPSFRLPWTDRANSLKHFITNPTVKAVILYYTIIACYSIIQGTEQEQEKNLRFVSLTPTMPNF